MHIVIKIITQFFRTYLPQIIIAVLIIITIGNNLLPSDSMFLFHDQTQYARILDFAYALQTYQIPPVSAAHFNFGIGYPIFLFYAPVAYWISSMLYLLGIGIVNAVRISMVLALITGGWGMYTWLNRRYARPAAFVGAMLFVASPWFASEMFVRGNLATVWFLALAPWSLWALSTFRRHKILAAFIIACTLMTHNALSLVWIPILFGYALVGFSHHRMQRMKLLLFAVFISGIFWIPALTQLGQTHAAEIAKLTNFRDHFLCIEQIWTTASWGFGGSVRGCTADGMSFMLGKIQLVFVVIGLVLGPFFIQRKRAILVEGLIMIWAIFLSLFDALPFWQLFPPMQVIQFPWRFLSVALIFSASLSAAAIQIMIEHIKIVTSRDRLGLNKLYKRNVTEFVHTLSRSALQRIRRNGDLAIPPLGKVLYSVVCALVVLAILISSSKFFYGKTMSVSEIERQFASDEYVGTKAAYAVPEYVPKKVNYAYWRSFQTRTPSDTDLERLKTGFSSLRPNALVQIGASILTLVSFILIVCLV